MGTIRGAPPELEISSAAVGLATLVLPPLRISNSAYSTPSAYHWFAHEGGIFLRPYSNVDGKMSHYC